MDSKVNKKFAWEENWQTEAGAWIAGERVVMHGENIMHSMQGKTWMEMMLLATTGKMPDAKRAKFLDEALAFPGCFPDPRLWNNRIAALAGTARSTSSLAISAATAASEAIIYGFPPSVGSYLMYEDILKQLMRGENLQDLLSARLAESKKLKKGSPAKGKNRKVFCWPGYGRPVARFDERITPLMNALKRYNFHEGAAVKLAFDIEKQLQAMGYKLSLNVGGLIAAIGFDQQLSMQEFIHYVTVCFNPGLMACYDDALKHPEGSFFPMRCEQIQYTGQSERQWQALL